MCLLKLIYYDLQTNLINTCIFKEIENNSLVKHLFFNVMELKLTKEVFDKFKIFQHVLFCAINLFEEV
jgi:hypothetical protein